MVSDKEYITQIKKGGRCFRPERRNKWCSK
nr:MAG TPA: hypothetical protein [Caudoviricetes sp.]